MLFVVAMIAVGMLNGSLQWLYVTTGLFSSVCIVATLSMSTGCSVACFSNPEASVTMTLDDGPMGSCALPVTACSGNNSTSSSHDDPEPSGDTANWASSISTMYACFSVE